MNEKKTWLDDVSCSKDELYRWFSELKNTFKKWSISLDSYLEAENIKKIIWLILDKIELQRDWILKLSNIDDWFEFLILKILYWNNDFESFWLAKKIEEILKWKDSIDFWHFWETLEELDVSFLHWKSFDWSSKNWYFTKISKNVWNLIEYSREEVLNTNFTFLNLIQNQTEKVELLRKITEIIKEKWNQINFEYTLTTKTGKEKKIYDTRLFKYDKDWNLSDVYWFIREESETCTNLITDVILEVKNIIASNSLELPGYKECIREVNSLEISDFLIFKLRNIDKFNSLFWREQTEELLTILTKNLRILEHKFSNYEWKLYQLNSSEYWFSIWKLIDSPIELITEITRELNNLDFKYKWLRLHLEFTTWAVFFEPENTFNKAQLALDEAKRKWKNSLIFSPWLEEQVTKESNDFYLWVFRIKESLTDSNEDEPKWEFQVYYQGIRDNITKSIYKYESLIRYKDYETEQVISPYLFLKHIDELKLTTKITEVVLKDILLKLQREKNTEYTLNISSLDLLSKTFKWKLVESFEILWIDKKRLTLEILEDITDDTNEEELYENIHFFKKSWFKIAIDDFWTWYSNLSKIIEIKPDFIKIDWSLIKNFYKNSENKRIIMWIMQIANSIWAKVIAEYVENEEIQKYLEILEVEYSQGYLFSKPHKK